MELQQQVVVGGTPLPNRAVFRPVRTNLSEKGRPTEELNQHLATRVRGGAGLVIGPAKMLVDPSASGPWFVNVYDETNIPHLESTGEAVHDEGGKIFGQLTHPGAEATGDWKMQAQRAPSAVASDSTHEMPAPMSVSEIGRMQDSFATAAKNLETAGFDGIELAAGPYSILRQFLSPKFNVRADEYGGTWKQRGRFVNETLSAVKDAVDLPVGLHLSVAELEYGGYEFEDLPEMLTVLDGFDYLSLTVGTASTYTQAHPGIGMEGHNLESEIATAREALDVPIIGQSSLTKRESVDSLFEAGADLVSFTRQLLADEFTVQKIADGDRPKRCIECNQKCLNGVFADAHGGHVECVINPRTGRENELQPISTLERAETNGEVLVIGGGPAGMRFATVASQRGHSVTLKEASAELGGQLKLAAHGILKSFDRSLEDLRADLENSAVTVQTKEPVEAGDVSDKWDAIVVATGATLSTVDHRDFEGEVTDALDILRGEPTGEDVLLIDENRWVITMQVGLELAAHDADVEIVTEDHYPGFRTEQPNLPTLVANLQAQGVEFTGNVEVEEVGTDGTVKMHDIYTGDVQTRNPDTVVYAGRRHAEESVYIELADRFKDVYRIGDAVSPRKLDRAYYDAEDLARRL